MNVAVFSIKNYEVKYLKDSNAGKHVLKFIDEPLSMDTVHLANGCDAVSIFTNDDATATVVEKLKGLGVKGIAIRAAGYDQTDIKKAKELNISVANVPEYSPYSIAEHTVAMILSLNRKIVRADRKVKEYNFILDDLVGFDLNGKTVGIIGLGKIGGIVAKILNGFGCKILGYDIQQNQEFIEKYGVEYVELEQLCKQADIISLHAPLNAHTKYMISKDKIGKMKDGVMIINTGRGGLINTQDTIDALKAGKIGYLGLDVYEKEKGLFFFDHTTSIPSDDLFARLLTFKNVLITGHQAFLTKNALTNIADTTIYNLDCWSKGNDTKHELTK